MDILLLLLLVVGVIGGFLWWQRERSARLQRELDDAGAEARRWYDRLGGQVYHLNGDTPAVRQALADAGERYNAAGAQLEQARTAHQFRLAQETAVEGLMYARAARIAMDMDPGPELPPLSAARGVGQLTERREAQVEGQTYRAGPEPSDDTPYYYPGGRVQGRPVPAGWYSQPLWRPALVGAGGALGAMLVMGALLPPPAVYGGYDQGFADGFEQGGVDPGADAGSGFGGDVGGDFGGF